MKLIFILLILQFFTSSVKADEHVIVKADEQVIVHGPDSNTGTGCLGLLRGLEGDGGGRDKKAVELNVPGVSPNTSANDVEPPVVIIIEVLLADPLMEVPPSRAFFRNSTDEGGLRVWSVRHRGPGGGMMHTLALPPEISFRYGTFGLAGVRENFQIYLGNLAWGIAPLDFVLGIRQSIPSSFSELHRIWVRTSAAELQALGLIIANDSRAKHDPDVLAVFDLQTRTIVAIGLPSSLVTKDAISNGVTGIDMGSDQGSSMEAGLFLTHEITPHDSASPVDMPFSHH